MDPDSDSDDVLNDLLANDEPEVSKENPEPEVPKTKPAPKKTLRELDFNFLDSSSKQNSDDKSGKQQASELYNDGADSSDDEDRRNFEEQKYSDYGRNIKTMLKNEPSTKTETKPFSRETGSRTFDFNTAIKSTNQTTSTTASKDVYSDPFFGLRIVSPLVSSAELRMRMVSKTPVTVSKVKYHVASENLDNDWVLAGVLISKSLPKTTQKGRPYSIWKISDLSVDIKTVCFFMFSNAHKTFWKTAVGTVVGFLNPNVLESKDNNDQATLSVDNPQKIMILGRSRDMGRCKSTKKNGDQCTSIVNVSQCEYCVYHVKKEYKKCSQRAELQSFSNSQAFSGDMAKRKSQQRKPTADWMQDFNPVYAKKSQQLIAKDAKRLALLSGKSGKVETPNDVKFPEDGGRKAEKSGAGQDVKQDFEERNKSRGWKATVMLQTPSNGDETPTSALLAKMSANMPVTVGHKNLSMLSASSPRLGSGCAGKMIDLSEPITKKHINIAKNNAIKWVKENGKIKPQNPNKVRLDKTEKVERGQKRPRETDSSDEQSAKKSNGLSDKFKEMMQAKSAHTDLIAKSDEREKEKYFNKLEMKERMEEKMLTTFKVACKAVRCLVCKYTSFSASDSCKEQKHPLRVTEATKRFFKCGDCGNRTVSLDRIPSHSCIKCSSSNWTRAAMMDEKKTNISAVPLSIRGDEENYIGAMTKDANLNLLVPETDTVT